MATKRGRRQNRDDSPRTERVQIRLYPDDLARIDALVVAGYGTNRSKVIRRSIAETHKWTIEAKR